MTVVGHEPASETIKDAELLHWVGFDLKMMYMRSFAFPRLANIIFEASLLTYEQALNAAIGMKKGLVDPWLYWIKLHCDGKLAGPEGIKDMYDFIKQSYPILEQLLPMWPIPAEVSMYDFIMKEYGVSNFYAALFVQKYNEGNTGARQLFDDIVASGAIKPNTNLRFDAPCVRLPDL